MPSWAARTAPSTSTAIQPDHAASVRDHAQLEDTHVQLSNGRHKGKGRIHERVIDEQNGLIMDSMFSAPSSKAMLNGKAPVTAAPGPERKHNRDSSGNQDNPTTVANEDPDAVSSSSSSEEVSPEDAEALLWDAQMALISHQYHTAVSCLTKAANAGSSTACLSLANIYLKGLPCTNHSHTHRKHVISPSKLIEGSISVDQTKTASYALQALELESTKPSFSEFDYEVLADASLLLCNMFRYGKIRPRDAARIKGPLKELAVSPQVHKPSSFLNPLLEDETVVQPQSAWIRGGKVARVLSERIEAALAEKGITWSTEGETDEGGSLPSDGSDTRESPFSLDDASLERLDGSLICLYYITALVTGTQEGPDAMQDSIRCWKKLLACHAKFQQLQKNSHKSKGHRNGGSPIRQSSGITTTILDGLVTKAEKRLHLLTTALQESETKTSPSRQQQPSPRDILLRRDTSEYSGSSLFSPTSESNINFGSVNTDPSSKQDSPNSLLLQNSDKSIDSLCSCVLPVSMVPKPLPTSPPPPAVENTPQRQRAAKFAIHDSPNSVRITQPGRRDLHHPAPLHSKKSVPSSLFKGFQTSSRSNLRQSLAGQSMSSSHLSLADLASSASSIAPSTRMRMSDARRPLLNRQPSQLSLASTATSGRRAWTTITAAPLSRISKLSSASLHTLAPTTDRQLARADVLGLPHETAQKPQQAGAAHILASLRSSTSSASPSSRIPASGYTVQLRNALSSLSSYFTPSTLSTQPEEPSKAKAELAKVAEQYDAEVENFCYWGEEERTSSEEESLHSGSPSNQGDHAQESIPDDHHSISTSHAEVPAEMEEQAPLQSSLSRPGRNMESTPQRPVYPLSTSISSSYLHKSTPASSPHRARESRFPPSLLDRPSKSALRDVKEMPFTAGSPTKIRESPLSNGSSTPYKPTKIDPTLAALEAASRVNVKSRCAVCGIEGINFPKCQRCDMTFCSRDCRIASGGEAEKHVCQPATTDQPI